MEGSDQPMADSRGRISTAKRPLAPPARRKIALGKTRGFEEHFAADLHVDINVQRTFDNKHAAKIEANWDPQFIGTLIVSRRENDTLYVIDGQHRCVVALRKDPAAIMDCTVYEGLSVEEEALMFLYFNRHRKQPNAYDQYKLGLAARLPVEIRMCNEAMARGLDYGLSPSKTTIAAVAACRRIVNMDKLETGLLQDTLMYSELAFGAGKDSWDNNLLQGIARLINHNRARLDHDRLIDKLRTNTIVSWQALALQGTKGGGGSVSRSIAMSRAIRDEYNKRLSATRKLQ